MKYDVILLPDAQRDIRDLPARFRFRLLKIIDGLANDPQPPRSKQMRDPLSHMYRIPLEKYRIIYEIVEDAQEIRIHYVRLKTGPETYEGLE